MSNLHETVATVPEHIKTEQELFSLWEKETSFFVRDGIFSKDDFASKKILFVLRDAHIVPDKAVPPYDLRDIVKYPEGEGNTWNNVARWTRALLDKAPYADVENISPSTLSAQLKRVAAINLKKEAGGPKAQNIKDFSSRHRNYIKRQIEIIDPDLIIACGTFVNIKRDVFENTRRCTYFMSTLPYRRWDVTVNSKSVPVIDFYHPQYNKMNQDLVEDMLKISEEIWGM